MEPQRRQSTIRARALPAEVLVAVRHVLTTALSPEVLPGA
jgi:hypothetical protein